MNSINQHLNEKSNFDDGLRITGGAIELISRMLMQNIGWCRCFNCSRLFQNHINSREIDSNITI